MAKNFLGPQSKSLKKRPTAKPTSKALLDMKDRSYLRGQNIARSLFQGIDAIRKTPLPEDFIRVGETALAHGFFDGLRLTLEDAITLVPIENRHRLVSWMHDDLLINNDKAMSIMGDGWVSPWLVHREKLMRQGADSRRLKMLTVGLYQHPKPFEAARCLIGMDEEYRLAAIEMLDSYSRFGLKDDVFTQTAEAVINGDME